MPSAAVLPSWPTPAEPARRFGFEVALGPEAGSPRALRWLLRRNCSITPRQLGSVFASLCVVSFLIAGFFFAQGAPLVLFFAGVELLAVGLAMLVFARHTTDREVLTLIGGSLQIEQHSGTRVARADFAADWVTVEPVAAQGSLVKLSSRGRSMSVGRFLRPELRAAFAQELRVALRHLQSHDERQAMAAS